jgi:uncharacterized protein YfaS (alpha-2-macroglobulin family)
MTRPAALARAAVLPLLLAGLACRQPPPRGLARVLQSTPQAGEAKVDALADGVRVTFDRPVVASDSVGRALATAPFVLEPAVAGEARWLDRQTLAFFPKEKLAPSTRYTVKLARGIEMAPDVALADWPGLSFVHDRIEIRSISFDGLRDLASRRPLVTVRASQAVRAADATAACGFFERRADGHTGARIDAALAKRQGAEADAEPDEASGSASGGPTRMLVLTPAEALRPATDYVFRCGPAFRPARGTEGLLAAREEQFSTHGPAGIKKMHPTGNDVAADDVKVSIEFATPMDPGAVRRHVLLIPEGKPPQPLDLAADGRRLVFTWSGDLEPGASYELVVGGGLEDAFGQVLAGETRQAFAVGDASPRLRTERGIYVVEKAAPRYPVFTRNMPSFGLRCAQVPEAKLAAVLTGPANYDSWWNAAGEGEVDYAGLGLRARERTIRPGAARNRWHDDSLDLPALCGSGRAGQTGGVYFLEIATEGEQSSSGDIGGRTRRSLASVTDLGLLAKVGNASSLVWVVRLSTGEPVAGATVKIRDLTGKVRFTGKTGADGVAEAPGAAKLVGLHPRGETNAAGESEEEGEDWADYRARRVIVTAQAGDDLGVLDTNWNNGVQIWNFGVPEDRRGGTVRVRGFLHSDRGLYRPGDTVHLRGLARVIDATGAMSLPGAGKGSKRRIHVTIDDPRGATLVTRDLAVTPFGGFSLDFPVAAEARLGDYVVHGSLDDQTFSDRFSVEEYRPRTFEVKVRTARANAVLGKPLKFELGASYLYGSPLRGGKLTWNVRRRLHVTRFPGWDEYAFQDYAALDGGRWWWAREGERSFSDPVADGELELDGAGKATVVVRDEQVKAELGPQDYLFEATVADKTGQAVTVGEAVTGHPGDLYLGLHPAEFVQAVGMPFSAQVVAFDPEGKRRGAEADLTITRRTYDCGTRGAGGYWSCDRKDDPRPALHRHVVVPAAGSAAVERVVIAEPGEYVVRVTAPDSRGRSVTTSEMIYVIGEGEAFWSGDEGDRMTLIASKARYRPGDTARLVPQARLPGATALTTLERDGILWHKVQRVGSTGEALEVPVDGRLAPNVFASVALVRGRSGDGDQNRPRFKMGLVNLEVDSSDNRLAVAVETDRPSYRPGDAVKARFKVTGADGAPVRAELAVAVADEGVLQIKGYKTPDPMPAFYAPWGLGVEASTTWNRILRRREPGTIDDDDEEGGDAGGEEAGRIRSRFMATVFWSPAVVTRADGTAEVTFTAPDNLTAFRVMAVGADTGDRFGSGERRFTVSKPLQAVPALPRFLTVGDEAEAAVLLSNNTGAALEATVRLAAHGLALRGAAAQTVKLAAHETARLAFPVRATEEGDAALTFRAAGGGHDDAVLARLPVERPSVPDVLVAGQGMASGRVEHKLPPTGPVVPGHGGLEVTLDRTGLARLDEGLRYLVGYPYGCLEQTTSKVVPMVALTELVRTVDLPGVQAGQARKFVEAGVAKILRFQHDDGGFGLWIGAPAETHYTAYGLWGLAMARAAGYEVDAAALENGAAYLKQRADERPEAGGSSGEVAGEEGDRAFAHYVLAVLGKPEPGSLAQLHERRAMLPIYGRAFLARGLWKAGQKDLARALASELGALVPGAAGPALVREGERNLDWYWSSDVRTTALVLSALIEIAPEHPAVARLEQGLLAARVEGRWSSTQENVHGLIALAELARARAAAGEVTVTVTAGGGKPVRRTLRGGAVERLRFDLGQLGAGPLVIQAEGGSIFYDARLRVERPLGGAAVDHGIAVERAYVDPETGAPLDKIRLGQVVKVRLTVRAPSRLAHVAVTDRLPAGFEPVLTRFSRSYQAENERGRSFWWNVQETAWQNVELRDDRTNVFADLLAAGESHHEYLARATTVGTFAAPPTTAEAMYQPERAGQGTAAQVVIVR